MVIAEVQPPSNQVVLCVCFGTYHGFNIQLEVYGDHEYDRLVKWNLNLPESDAAEH